MHAIFALLPLISLSNVFCKLSQNTLIPNENYTVTKDIERSNEPLLKSDLNVNTASKPGKDSTEGDKTEGSKTSYYTSLWSITTKELSKIIKNVRNNYKLNTKEMIEIDKQFNNTKQEYELLLQHKLNNIIENNEFSSTEDFQIELLDTSNFILKKIVDFSLTNANYFLSIPTHWHNQTLKDKIFRQQMKVSISSINKQMCQKFSVCKEPHNVYTDFVKEWLRFLISEKGNLLREFFGSINVVLDNHKGFVKTNKQLKKNIQYATKVDPMAQRDFLDYVDEVITNPYIFELIPDPLIKCTILLIDLLYSINEIYKLDDRNSHELESISESFINRPGSDDWVKGTLDAILKNMQRNFKTWPKKNQDAIKSIWNDILVL